MSLGLEITVLVCIISLAILGIPYFILGIIDNVKNMHYQKECKERYFKHLDNLEKIEKERTK